MHTGLWWWNKKRGHLEYLGVDGGIMTIMTIMMMMVMMIIIMIIIIIT
jgi:hypothetical protein